MGCSSKVQNNSKCSSVLQKSYKKTPQKLAPVLNSKCSLTEQFKFTGVNFLTKNGLGIEIKFEFTNYLFFHI